jgi:hypothetical protein
MNTIELLGLPSNHIAAALATYGLFDRIPDCKINYERKSNGTYFPVLQTEKYKSIDELVAFLADPQTWNDVPTQGYLKGTQFPVTEFNALVKIDSAMANGVGTDLKLTLSEKEFVVGKSPFNLLTRRATISSEMIVVKNKIFDAKIRNEVYGKTISADEVIKDILTKYSAPSGWTRIPGQNFGLFYEDINDNVFRNKEGTYTVPIICLLALAGMRMLPCFTLNRDVLTPGWHKANRKMYFTYPVFTSPLKKWEVISLLYNDGLRDYSKNRNSWKRQDIPVVYQVEKRTYGKEAYITAPKSL